jgi:phosphoglycolate phosphatase
MPLTHLAFDMDGVIYTAEDFIADAYKEAINESPFILPIPSTSEIIRQIGKPIWDIFMNLFPDITKSEMLELRKYTRKWVVKMVSEKRGQIYQGIPEMLEELSRKSVLYICSNGGSNYVETILKVHGLKKYFQPVLTLDSENLKNKSELLEAYILKNETTGISWVMLGDRKTDLDAARYNNCFFIGCTWGQTYDGELTDADIIVKTPGEVPDILTALYKP